MTLKAKFQTSTDTHTEEKISNAGTLNEERKAKVKASLTRLKNKAQATNELLNTKINGIQKELDGKVHAIQDQIKEANEKRKAKLQKRLGSMQEEYKVRMAKLKKASVLINEALKPKSETRKTETASVLYRILKPTLMNLEQNFSAPVIIITTTARTMTSNLNHVRS